MDNIEAYSYLFSDSLFSNLIINFYGELVIDVMLILGGYDNILILIISSLGSFIAGILNFVLGLVIRTAKKTEEVIQASHHYFKINHLIGSFLYILLLFSGLPIIGPILLVILGLFRIKLNYLSILLLLLSKIIYYSSKIYLSH
ncbi:MAG: hypothetical protein ACK4OM_01975 [Alphaproteobacteria bacterium]